MSILAPAKMRLWVEMWKEEVLASIPSNELQQKFQEKQVQKGHLPAKPPDKLQPKLDGGGQIL
jgi:hypothetical protein